uniref:Phosphatidic acid phosphatase type 2/haloperoxidase domain-containing protein n=1 Tax=Neolamprologus brichardi TaxID=32507 RepID=A0A3Q4HTI2_NEOBR
MFYFQLVIMAGTVLLAYYFEYTDTFPVHIQGFFCFDKAYSKPYPGPEENSKAPPVLVYSLVTAIPTVTILIGEVTSFFVKTEGAQEKTIVTADCCYFNPLLRRIVTWTGCAINHTYLSNNYSKNASKGSEMKTWLVSDSCRKHYILKMYLIQYITAFQMYVTLVFRTKGTRLMKPTLCLVLLSLAVLVGVVRVTEHRNHWNDVLAGFVTGGAIAAFLVSCVINNFRPTQIAAPTPPPPQRSEPPVGLPLLSLPRVESPLEKLSGLQVRGGGNEMYQNDQNNVLNVHVLVFLSKGLGIFIS